MAERVTQNIDFLITDEGEPIGYQLPLRVPKKFTRHQRDYGTGVRIAFIGASFVNRCSPGSSGAGVYTAYTPANWFAWAQSMLGGVLRPLVFGGVGGNPVSLVARRFATDIAPYLVPGDYVFIGGDGFGNSINSGVSPASQYADWITMVNAVLDLGCVPIVATCPPNINVVDAATAAIWYGINKLVVDYCRTDPRLILVRWDVLHTDPTSTYPNSPAANGWTIDDTHPQPKLAIPMGRQFANALLPRLMFDPMNAVPWHTHNSDGYRLLENPTMSGSSGGVSTSWSLTGAGSVGSKVSRTDAGHGREHQRIVSTAAGANARLAQTNAFTIPTSGNFVPQKGVDYIKIWAKVQLNSAPTNLKGIQTDIQFVGSTNRTIGFATGSIAASIGGNYADAGAYIPTGIPLVIESPEILIPSGATGLKAAVEMTKSAAGNMTADLYVDDVMIEVVPAGRVPYVVLMANID